MRAWRFTGTHDPLVLQDVPEPTATPGHVVVDVKAAGLCHSDVGLFEDEKWLQMMTLPVTPGHEIAGVISQVGEGVTGWQIGDNVCVWVMQELHGYQVDGGFGDKVSVHPDALIRIPDGVSFPQAAAATDAGMTSYGAIFGTGKVTAGTKLGIIGFGGLGQIGARCAVLEGAEVYVAEIKEELWPLIEQAGVSKVVKNVRDLAEFEPEVIVDLAGFGTTTADAIEAIAPGGRVVLVGMGKLEATINTYPLIMKAAQLCGSVGGTKEHIAAVLGWMAKGELKPVLTEIPFDEIADGIQRLHDGKVTGRLVAHVAD